MLFHGRCWSFVNPQVSVETIAKWSLSGYPKQMHVLVPLTFRGLYSKWCYFDTLYSVFLPYYMTLLLSFSFWKCGRRNITSTTVDLHFRSFPFRVLCFGNTAYILQEKTSSHTCNFFFVKYFFHFFMHCLSFAACIAGCRSTEVHWKNVTFVYCSWNRNLNLYCTASKHRNIETSKLCFLLKTITSRHTI